MSVIPFAQKAIFENLKMVGFLKSHRKGVFLWPLYSEIWGETENLGTMMDTLTFIRDDLVLKLQPISQEKKQRQN